MSYSARNKIIKPISTISSSGLSEGNIVTFDSGYVYPADGVYYYSDKLDLSRLFDFFNSVYSVFKFSETRFGIVWYRNLNGFYELWLSIFEVAKERFVRLIKQIKLEDGQNWNNIKKTVAVNDDIIVIVGMDKNNSNYLTAKAYDISGYTKATEGTPLVIDSLNPNQNDAILIDTDKILVGWYEYTNKLTKTCTLTISEADLSISAGTIYSTSSFGNGFWSNWRGLVLTKLNTNKYLLVRNGHDGTNCKTVAYFVTDSSISDATDVSGGVTPKDVMYYMSIGVVNNTTAYVVGHRYTHDGSNVDNRTTILKIDVDDNGTITSSILQNFGNNGCGLGVTKLSDDKIALSFNVDSNYYIYIYQNDSLLYSKSGFTLATTNYFCAELLAPTPSTLVNCVDRYVQFIWESDSVKPKVPKYVVSEYNSVSDLLIEEHKE